MLIVFVAQRICSRQLLNLAYAILMTIWFAYILVLQITVIYCSDYSYNPHYARVLQLTFILINL